jgi:hypothetical protein
VGAWFAPARLGIDLTTKASDPAWIGDYRSFLMEALLDCVISVPPHVKWSESNGEILFFDEEREQIFGLDYVGADAFLHLARREPLAKVIDDLLREYEVERSVLERDLTQLLNALRDQGIIQIERPPG